MFKLKQKYKYISNSKTKSAEIKNFLGIWKFEKFPKPLK